MNGQQSIKTINSIEALKVIFFVIIGVSITSSLEKLTVILPESRTISNLLFNFSLLIKDQFLLFIAFMATLVRFCLGVVCILDKHENKPRIIILVTYIFFILIACSFFAMGLNVDNADMFAVSLIFLLVFDLAWIIIDLINRKLNNLQIEKSMYQWIKSNIAIFVVLGIFFVFRLPLPLSNYLFIIAILAAVWDFISNHEFYFSIT